MQAWHRYKHHAAYAILQAEAFLPKQHFPSVKKYSSLLVHNKLQVKMVYAWKIIMYYQTGPYVQPVLNALLKSGVHNNY
jgi:hypothetical protein